MKDYFERCEFFEEARYAKTPKNPEKKRGLPLILELLVFVAVFIVSTFAQLLVVVPGSLFVALPDEAMILSLFSDIMLILVILVFCRIFQKRKPRTLGFIKKHMISQYFLGFLLGIGMFSLAVFFCVITGAMRLERITDFFSLGVFLLFLLGFMIQGMAEEVLCRGYFMVSIARRYSLPVAILTNALFFAMLHLGNQGISALAFLNLTLFGIFASLLFVRTKNIWLVGAMHSAWNLVQGNVFGVRVSGITIECRLLQAETQDKFALIHGGSFGLEGGLAVTLIYVVGILILCLPVFRSRESSQPSESK